MLLQFRGCSSSKLETECPFYSLERCNISPISSCLDICTEALSRKRANTLLTLRNNIPIPLSVSGTSKMRFKYRTSREKVQCSTLLGGSILKRGQF